MMDRGSGRFEDRWGVYGVCRAELTWRGQKASHVLFTAYQFRLTVAHRPVLSTQPRPGSGRVAFILPLLKSLPSAIPTRPEPWRTRKNTGRSRLGVRQTAQR